MTLVDAPEAIAGEVEPSTWQGWVPIIRQAQNATVEAILEEGRVWRRAKAAVAHGQFTRLIKEVGTYPDRVERLMLTAGSVSLAKSATWRTFGPGEEPAITRLPPTERTLALLARLPEEDLWAGIESGEITPSLTVKAAKALLDRHTIVPAPSPPAPVPAVAPGPADASGPAEPDSTVPGESEADRKMRLASIRDRIDSYSRTHVSDEVRDLARWLKAELPGLDDAGVVEAGERLTFGGYLAKQFGSDNEELARLLLPDLRDVTNCAWDVRSNWAYETNRKGWVKMIATDTRGVLAQVLVDFARRQYELIDELGGGPIAEESAAVLVDKVWAAIEKHGPDHPRVLALVQAGQPMSDRDVEPSAPDIVEAEEEGTDDVDAPEAATPVPSPDTEVTPDPWPDGTECGFCVGPLGPFEQFPHRSEMPNPPMKGMVPWAHPHCIAEHHEECKANAAAFAANGEDAEVAPVPPVVVGDEEGAADDANEGPSSAPSNPTPGRKPPLKRVDTAVASDLRNLLFDLADMSDRHDLRKQIDLVAGLAGRSGDPDELPYLLAAARKVEALAHEVALTLDLTGVEEPDP